jgi:hypothetical protein
MTRIGVFIQELATSMPLSPILPNRHNYPTILLILEFMAKPAVQSGVKETIRCRNADCTDVIEFWREATARALYWLSMRSFFP